MLNKNNLSTGVLIGLILPLLSALLFEVLFKDATLFGRRAMPYIIVGLLNLGILRYFAHKHQDKTVQGIMLVTFVFIMLVFIYRFKG